VRSSLDVEIRDADVVDRDRPLERLDAVVPKASTLELCERIDGAAPKRLREIASRLSMLGRSRCEEDEGVFGAEAFDVRNLKMP
jgi:hypothetical protein